MTTRCSILSALRIGFLHAAAGLTRRIHPRGTERVLRFLHKPDSGWGFASIVRLRNGALLNVETRNLIEWRAFYLGEFEPEIQRVMETQLGDGDCAIDVGANVGIHTLTMSGAVGRGRVIAFEPYPAMARRLEANLKLNEAANVQIFEVALGEGTGIRFLHLPPAVGANQGMASLLPLGDWNSLPVEVTTLDEVVRELQPPSIALIKIDVEGFEPQVLSGGKLTLQEHRPLLLFEYDAMYWREEGHTFADVRELLEGLGYRAFFLVSQDGLVLVEKDLLRPGNVLAATASQAKRLQ